VKLINKSTCHQCACVDTSSLRWLDPYHVILNFSNTYTNEYACPTASPNTQSFSIAPYGSEHGFQTNKLSQTHRYNKCTCHSAFSNTQFFLHITHAITNGELWLDQGVNIGSLWLANYFVLFYLSWKNVSMFPGVRNSVYAMENGLCIRGWLYMSV
jgi:hypothetical protein